MRPKIKNIQKPEFFNHLNDVRTIGLLVFAVIALLVTYSSVGAIETNYGLQKQVYQLEEQNKLQALENTNISLQNQYYNSNEYLELQARQLYGKALPGENMILVPDNVALANSTNLGSNNDSTNQLPKPFYQRNFEAWMQFYFH